MWDHRFLWRIDYRVIFLILSLMVISLVVISSMTGQSEEAVKDVFFTFYVKKQIKWFIIGWIAFFFFAGVDYRKLRQWTWPLYFLIIVLLLGLYIVSTVCSVHRWYRFSFIGMSLQPSEHAKLVIVLTLGWFLDRKDREAGRLITIFQIFLIVGLPFLLILKQPDLGTALVLFPITFIMCYFGGINKKILKVILLKIFIVLMFVILLFLKILPHDKMKPFFTSFLKEYQYERLNPNSYHQRAATTAIAIGGVTGIGWHKSEFAARKWLPAAHTDSVFASFGEEFGLIGLIFLLFLFYSLIYLSFQVVVVAKDRFGRLLSSGIALYLAMHIIVNIAMMCGLVPISGVPLILVTYGGTSVLTTMSALGMLQSIYVRRFMF